MSINQSMRGGYWATIVLQIFIAMFIPHFLSELVQGIVTFAYFFSHLITGTARTKCFLCRETVHPISFKNARCFFVRERQPLKFFFNSCFSTIKLTQPPKSIRIIRFIINTRLLEILQSIRDIIEYQNRYGIIIVNDIDSAGDYQFNKYF